MPTNAAEQSRDYRVLVLLAAFLPVVEAAHRHRPPNMDKAGCGLCELRVEARRILEGARMAPKRHEPGGDWKWSD